MSDIPTRTHAQRSAEATLITMSVQADIRRAFELRDQEIDALRMRVEREAAEVRRLTDALAREEQAHSLTIDQREACHTAADSLAYAIAPVEVIGEHSNLNDPWANAEEALEVERRTHAAALATARLDGARVMHDKVRERTAALRVTIGAVAEADTRPDVDMEDEIHDLWLTVDQIEALDPAAVVGSGP